jgi:hypothetical protein
VNRKRLSIYLQDHLAGSTAGLELARRVRTNNADGELGSFLEELVAEIELDRRALVDLMARLGIGEDRVKTALAWAGEKAGRLKLNGEILSYSPLSRLVELEGLALGVHGKLAMWRSLREIAATHEGLEDFDLEAPIARAERQVRRIEARRRRAAEEALT